MTQTHYESCANLHLCWCLRRFLKEELVKHQLDCPACASCPGCKKIFNKDKLDEHIRECGELYLCWCLRRFLKDDLAEHQSKCDSCWTCVGCKKVFKKDDQRSHCC
eukprot:TRINITY_DN77177_c0_g1_i1.p1 TRINITY_DN77177_c0_g1~~TRINITY_DN77177_c0_g1_i1.p1  ORF type:complete len:106 (+),score=23.21 TRINITY_DN77177_c0_g1_i1:70-387(+)